MSDDGAPTQNAGYDEWLDALAADEGYALVCPAGHGSLPPRRICPECGSTSLSEELLPTVGRVETATVVHVPPPRFADDAPYVTAIASFDPVRLTGVLRGVDLDGTGSNTGSDSGDRDGVAAVGTSVEVCVETRATDEGSIVVFRPIDD
ncbi:MAG: OB-fold domain-containing protein [Halorubrum sp.]